MHNETRTAEQYAAFTHIYQAMAARRKASDARSQGFNHSADCQIGVAREHLRIARMLGFVRLLGGAA